MQKSSLKTIYGFNQSYGDCLRRLDLQTLKDRRTALFKNFTRKAYESDVFKYRWFADKGATGYDLRHKNVVVENFAAHDQLANAPIYRYRRLINEEARADTRRRTERE